MSAWARRDQTQEVWRCPTMSIVSVVFGRIANWHAIVPPFEEHRQVCQDIVLCKHSLTQHLHCHLGAVLPCLLWFYRRLVDGYEFIINIISIQTEYQCALSTWRLPSESVKSSVGSDLLLRERATGMGGSVDLFVFIFFQIHISVLNSTFHGGIHN